MQWPSSVIATTPACAREPIGASSSPAMIFRDRASRQNVDAGNFRSAILDPRNRARIISRRRSVRHAYNRGESARRSCARARFNRFLPTEPRFAQVHMDVDEARTNDKIGRIDLIGLRVEARELRGRSNKAINNQKIADLVAVIRRIDDAPTADDRSAHSSHFDRRRSSLIRFSVRSTKR